MGEVVVHTRGSYAKKEVFIPRIKITPSASSNFPFEFQRKQFPIKLSFAMTINKAQGQTLKEVAVFLRQPCFTHGQLYVALSRAKKASQVKDITPTTVGEINRQWAARNKVALTDHRSKIIEVHTESKVLPLTALATLNMRTAKNTWQDEIFCICVTIPTASIEEIKPYLGCSKCGKICNAAPESAFICNYCNKPDAIAEHKAIFKTEVLDNTGSLVVTMFAKEIEQILGINCSQLWTLKEKDSMGEIAPQMKKIRKTTFNMTIGPTRSLTKSKILSWAVHSVAFE